MAFPVSAILTKTVTETKLGSTSTLYKIVGWFTPDKTKPFLPGDLHRLIVCSRYALQKYKNIYNESITGTLKPNVNHFSTFSLHSLLVYMVCIIYFIYKVLFSVLYQWIFTNSDDFIIFDCPLQNRIPISIQPHVTVRDVTALSIPGVAPADPSTKHAGCGGGEMGIWKPPLQCKILT